MFNDIRGDVTSGSDSLLQAIQKREFKPYIQPIVCASNHKIIGGELLVRWHTSHRGVIYPDSFIDNMEKAGILSELTCSIINEVVVNFDGENKFNSEDFILHVNVAPSLLHNKKFISTCIRVAKKNNLSLVLELTEQYFFTMDSKTISTFHCLKESGVQFALDDFGTGYANLCYLNELDLDVIKIDKTFIKAIKEVEQHIPMLESIIHLSELLGLRMVAEGVEYGYQQQWLGKNNVDYLQGYQFLPPVTFDDFMRYYKQTVNFFESASDSTFST